MLVARDVFLEYVHVGEELKTYLDVVKSVLDNGIRKSNRTGVDTLSLFGVSYTLDMKEGFPLLTTKQISWKNIICENLWFLSGKPHIHFLQKHGCKFWNPWADKSGFVPSAYGNLWRNFPTQRRHHDGSVYSFYFDQIDWVLNELKRNPDSRRLVVSAWNPGNACSSKLPPCHYSFVLNVQGDELNIMVPQRSLDVALGLPYNIAGYAFLLHLFAHMTGLKPGKFMHAITDCHIYVNHIEALKKQLSRSPKPLPQLHINRISSLESIEQIVDDFTTKEILEYFNITNYAPHPEIKFKVAV